MKSLSTEQYFLPDFNIFDSDKSNDFAVWQPDAVYVILGRGSQAKNALIAENIIADCVKVLKRPSGGESVVLSSEMLIISVKKTLIEGERIQSIFEPVNIKIIEALHELGVENLSIRGISDICIGNKKILGSSAYRQPDKIFYHAVLNVSQNIEIFERYLKHPAREPEYRAGRSHKDFVTSLEAEKYTFGSHELEEILKTKLSHFCAV